VVRIVNIPLQMIANTPVATAPVIHGSTPISQIGVQSNPLPELQPNMCESSSLRIL